jgi:hypothetical protein
MEKYFTHKVKFYSLNKTHEFDETVCNHVVRDVNKDIDLYGEVVNYFISHRNKTYEFHIKLSSHHGPEAQGYICGLINGILIQRGMDIVYDN